MRTALLLALAIALLWAANSSWLAEPDPAGETRLLAHRGVHQVYAGDDRTGDACKADKVAPITHGFIENTLPSMRAAVAAGADVIELDVHLTPDGYFAVFHDWTLECQTDGQGVTEKTTMTVLKTLDLGHGFSDDGGETFPLRGTGVGLMPTLKAVFEADLDVGLLINFKSRRAEEGRTLATMLERADWRAQVWGVYGGAEPTRAALAGVAGLKGYDKAALLACLKPYLALGWSGYVPPPCRETILAVPISHAKWLWDWPHRFTRRMARHGTDVILLGDWDGSGFSTGIDSAGDFARVPKGFDGYVWTNRIEVIGRLP